MRPGPTGFLQSRFHGIPGGCARGRRVLQVVGLGLLLGMCGVSGVSRAQSVLPADLPVTAVSRSGQFVVHGRESSLPAPVAELKRVNTNSVVSLRPDLLVVSAERVKKAVEQRLGATDPWRAKIHLALRDAARMEGPVSIRGQQFRDGWQFYVPLPERIEWNRLIRALVEVVLLERANRANGGAEVALPPLWLSEGLTQLLLAEEGRDLVAESATIMNRSQLKPDPLAPARQVLDGREPMPFTDLGLLTLDQLGDPGRWTEFQANASLFTAEMLRDDSGRRWARAFLNQLPQSLNWQTALLRSSEGGFSSLLDIEKWWAVSAAETLAAGPTQRWPRQRVLERLNELRIESASVRPDTNSPPVVTQVALPQLVTTWEFPLQREVLNRKASQWRTLALRATPDLAALCLDYARVTQEYISARESAGVRPTARGGLEGRTTFIAEAAARRYSDLDRRLEAAALPQGANLGAARP